MPQSIAIDWELVAVATDLTDGAIPAAGYGTYTITTGAGAPDHDIQLASGWGSKSMNLDANAGATVLEANETTFNFDSTAEVVEFTARVGSSERGRMTLHWDGLIAPGFSPNPNNGYVFQNRTVTSSLTITRWLNGSFVQIANKIKGTANNNDYIMKCVIKVNGTLELWIDGVLELSVVDTDHKSGGIRFGAVGFAPAFYDDILITQAAAGGGTAFDSHGRRGRR